MSLEEDIKRELVGRFGYLENRINTPRPRRLFLDIDQVHFEEVFDYAVKGLKFSHLISITGLDEPARLSFIYHLAQDTGVVFNIRTSVDKNNPVINTVTGHFPGAEIYELELVDLFGAKVEGLEPGNRYPLSDDWPKDQFPLRKDWKPSG